MTNWAAATYCAIVDTAIWVIFSYAVFWQGHSGWWFLLAIFASGSVGVPEGVHRSAKSS